MSANHTRCSAYIHSKMKIRIVEISAQKSRRTFSVKSNDFNGSIEFSWLDRNAAHTAITKANFYWRFQFFEQHVPLLAAQLQCLSRQEMNSEAFYCCLSFFLSGFFSCSTRFDSHLFVFTSVRMHNVADNSTAARHTNEKKKNNETNVGALCQHTGQRKQRGWLRHIHFSCTDLKSVPGGSTRSAWITISAKLLVLRLYVSRYFSFVSHRPGSVIDL